MSASATLRGVVGGVLGLSVLGAVLEGQERRTDGARPSDLIGVIAGAVSRFLDPGAPFFGKATTPRELTTARVALPTTPAPTAVSPPATPVPISPTDPAWRPPTSSTPSSTPGQVRVEGRGWIPTTSTPATVPTLLPNGRLRSA